MVPFSLSPAAMPSRSCRLLVLLLVLNACSDNAAIAHLATLKQALPLQIALTDAEATLRQQGVTFTRHSAAECEDLNRNAQVQSQLPPKGGPCLFGKKEGPHNWYGAHQDVILQLVFDSQGRMADGHFEVVDGY